MKEKKTQAKEAGLSTGIYLDYRSRLNDEYGAAFDKVEEWCLTQTLSSAELNESLGFIVSVALTSALMDTLIFTLILAVMFMLFSLTLFIYPVRIRRQFQQIMDESGESFFDDAIYPVIDEKVR